MARKNKESLTCQIQMILEGKLAAGTSKHNDKILGGKEQTDSKIYAYSTLKTYMKHCNYFARYCKEQHGCKTIEQCRPYVNEWIASRQHLSPYTLKTETSALAKLYTCQTTDFIPTPVRIRSNITRSRQEAVRDKCFSEEKNKDLVAFCQSTGLRRKELECLRGRKNGKVNCHTEDGKLYVHVVSGAKGGKKRQVEVIGNEALVKSKIMKAGEGKVFERVHNAADVHGYRRDYATAIYNRYARPIEEIPYDRINNGTKRWYQSEVYCCKGDQKGRRLDKVAMKIASQNLGHNRICIIAEHYLK